MRFWQVVLLAAKDALCKAFLQATQYDQNNLCSTKAAMKGAICCVGNFVLTPLLFFSAHDSKRLETRRQNA